MQQTFRERLLTDPTTFHIFRRFLGEDAFKKIVATSDSVDDFTTRLKKQCTQPGWPAYLPELADMEGHVLRLVTHSVKIELPENGLMLNPGLKLFSNTWEQLCGCLDRGVSGELPTDGREKVLVWLDPVDKTPLFRPATSEDLLVLKMVVEDLDAGQVAAVSGTTAASVNSAILRALEAGIILGPKSGISRVVQPETSKTDDGDHAVADTFRTPRVFALQWHITQACDLHCRHCYDRTSCASLTLDQEIAILDSLDAFCTTHNLFGQVSFTGGNPLLHPNFHRLYQEAADRGFFTGILGNPIKQESIDAITAIQVPSFFQMSLEGLEEHNDHIRGPGHFQRVMTSLETLRRAGIYTKIMLTLTRDNLDQVIPLGNLLKDRVDLFTFSRLSLMGEGANLVMADPDTYRKFLESYAEIEKTHPVFGLKENLFNIIFHKNNAALFGGCTGFGCGAAFNFVSVLATGKVHACRKLPSLIGDITRQSLAEIYHSHVAARYRKGPEECISCRLNPVCRGCLASAYSHGMNIFKHKDPYCFFQE